MSGNTGLARVQYLPILLLVACAEQPPTNVHVSDWYPDAIPDALEHWEATEGDLSAKCRREADRALVRALPDVSGPCAGAAMACVDYWSGGNLWDTIVATESVPLITLTAGHDEEPLVRHELGHIWYLCRDGAWDYDHEGAYFQHDQ